MVEPRFRKDLLLRLHERKVISRYEYLAGREWQHYLETVQLQGAMCYDWDVPIFAQKLYQHAGDFSEAQELAYDVRCVLRAELGVTAFTDLDRLLSLPHDATVRLSADGEAYVARLLQIVSVALSIQAGGTEFGAPQEEWERKDDARERARLLEQEQPWLFAPSRRQPGKPASAKVLGRMVA